jgi:hypothetical protein
MPPGMISPAIELLDKYLVLDPEPGYQGTDSQSERKLSFRKKRFSSPESFTQEMDTLARDYYTVRIIPKPLLVEKLLQWGAKMIPTWKCCISLLVSRTRKSSNLF